NLFEGQKPGDYSIIVTDGVCPEYRFINVGPAKINYNIITEQAENPTGAGNGLIFLEAEGGIGTLTFTLFEQTLGEIANNTTGLFENLYNGVYYVEISDDNLCTVTTRDIFLAGLQVTITPTNVSCNGANDGQIEITVDGGTLPYTITWSNTAGPLPDFNDMLLITGLAPDTYTVYIVDSEGIDITLVQDITEPDELQTSTTITPPTCTGDTNGAILVEALGGTPPYTYTLTDADSQEVTATSEGLYENLAAGDYTINIEDANGCTFSSLLTLPEAEPITYSVIKEHPTGFGETDGTIVVSALPDTYTYAFTLFTQSGTEVENNTTGSFSGLGAGSYYVIIENEFGCSVQTETIVLTAITLEITPHPVSCFGGSDGWIEVEIFGGLPPFNTVVTSIETGETFDSGIGINAENAVLPAGSYTVSVTDNAGHTITQTAEVTQPAELIASIVEAVQPLCYGVASGYVVFNIEGGTPDYTISWDGGSATGLIAENLDAGTYLFTITDANGCEFVFEEEVVITYPEGMTLTNLSFFDIPCYGDNSGYISMYVEGGTLPVTYTVEGPEGFTESNNNGVFSQLLPGIYNLFITDANGCQYLFEEGNRIVINEPDSIEISTLVNEIDTLDCHYDVAGVINMQVSGGTPDYSYLWSNGQQTLDLYNPTPGTYTIRVTDSQGCTAFKDVKIPGPEPLMLDYNISLANCIVAPEGDVGGITINGLTGGNGVFPVDFSIEWYSEKLGHIENLDNVWDPIEQTYGYYTAVITDAKDCKDTLDFYIPFDETKNFTLELLAIDTACYGSDVEMSVAAYEYGVIDPQPYLVTNPEYMWFDLNTSDNEPVFEGEDSYTTVLTEKTKFRVDVMSGDGCLAQVTDSVDVHARMLPYIPRILEYHPFLFNNYEDTTVIAVLSDTQYEFTVVEGGEGKVETYTWTPDPVFFPAQYTWDEVWIDETVTPYMEFKTPDYLDHQDGEIVSPSGKIEKYIPLKLTVISTMGCPEIIEYKAIVLNQIRIPNAFSPNSDGINDFWKLPYAELFANMTVRVYNRWGALIWSAKGTEIGDGWDGKNSNGKDYPVGTYYYVIDYNVEGTTKWKSVSGSITIVR
ncbi:MAG TPA: gliding motility-associated C-terminal domain-containing protein, partial [Tenuifilaceae bacterium]|nr:gliding motility-associated C-terminal domain-containing protein [Tenuifilaceae bacterium]